MILKKPYAFLIKYFKIINLILAVLTVFLTFYVYKITGFFNDYIKSGYVGNFHPGFYQSYVPFFVFLVLIIIIIGVSLILLLFIYKKKPVTFYSISLFYFIVAFMALIYIRSTMITMETTVISAQLSRVLRDISFLSIIFLIVFIILFLMRGFGFNTGKFNFENDLKDLAIDSGDSDEVEITFKSDGTTLKRTLRRFFREFGYYIKENKYVVMAIFGVVIIVAVYFSFKTVPEAVEETYNEGDTFTLSGIKYTILDSMVTNMDYKGNYLGENIYYVVVKLQAENPSDYNYNMDYKNFRLELGDSYVYPKQDLGQKFVDFAPSYQGNLLRKNSSMIFSLTYQINLSDLKKNYTLKIENGNNDFIYVKITADVLENIETVGTFPLDSEVKFTESNLGNTTLKLSNPVVTNKYIFNYDYCKKDKCTTYKDQVAITKSNRVATLLVLDYEYNLDKDAPFASYSTTFAKFLESFARLQYLEDDEMIYTFVTNLTPSNLKGKVALEVTSKIYSSKEYYLSFIIRNKEYNFKIR